MRVCEPEEEKTFLFMFRQFGLNTLIVKQGACHKSQGCSFAQTRGMKLLCGTMGEINSCWPNGLCRHFLHCV